MSYKTLVFILVTILAINIVVLYWMSFTLNARVDKQLAHQSTVASASAQLVEDPETGKIVERNVTFVGPTQSCENCTDRIDILEDELFELKQTVKSQNLTNVTTNTSTTTVRETFVPLGGGSISDKEWSDVPGASAYIDPGNYSGLKTATFEGSIRVPQKVGGAYVRLYNVTKKHPVWFSEHSTESDIAYVFQSSPITLDSGNNLYQVQMKSTIGSEVDVESARVRIVTQ